MQDIQTTGGLFTEESRKTVVKNICNVFSCEEEVIEELVYNYDESVSKLGSHVRIK